MPRGRSPRTGFVGHRDGRPALRGFDRPAVDSGHLYRCFRFAVLWRDGQADDLPVGTATGCGFAVIGGNTEARRPAEPACRSGGCGGRCTFAIATSGSARTARRGSRPDPPELTQLLQTMARDLANVQQGIEQLKTSQEEMVRENARTAEQLKASQEQMARAIANASEQNLRRRTSVAPPPAARKPVSALPTEARAQARAPVHCSPDNVCHRRHRPPRRRCERNATCA